MRRRRDERLRGRKKECSKECLGEGGGGAPVTRRREGGMEQLDAEAELRKAKRRRRQRAVLRKHAWQGGMRCFYRN
jgi:hypothetical protein